MQHFQARAVVLAAYQEARAQWAQAAIVGAHQQRARVLMTGFDRNLALVQHDHPLLAGVVDIHGRVAVQAQQGAVFQAQGTQFAGGGALVGQPVARCQRWCADPGQQRAQQKHAGQPAADLADTSAQPGARLQQGLACRAGSGAHALVHGTELAPGAGMLLAGGMPAHEFAALVRCAAAVVEAELPGNGGFQHPGRNR